MKRAVFIAGGVATLSASVAAFLFGRTASKAKDAVDGVAPPMAPGGMNTVKVHLTTYWPFVAGLSAKERLMEGAPVDRKKNPLHTVEDFLSGTSDHVSLAGDYTIFPYGQKMLIPWGDKTLVGRITDTGGHFHGGSKLFRVVGAEPIDVCVFSESTKPPKTTVDAQVVIGDHLDKSSAVAQLDKAGKPQVAGLFGLDVFSQRSR